MCLQKQWWCTSPQDCHVLLFCMGNFSRQRNQRCVTPDKHDCWASLSSLLLPVLANTMRFKEGEIRESHPFGRLCNAIPHLSWAFQKSAYNPSIGLHIQMLTCPQPHPAVRMHINLYWLQLLVIKLSVPQSQLVHYRNSVQLHNRWCFPFTPVRTKPASLCFLMIYCCSHSNFL